MTHHGACGRCSTLADVAVYRRDSELPSALCRPCDSVAPVVHDY